MRFSFLSRKKTMQRSLRARPRLELLEDRTLPSITPLASFDGLDFAGTIDGAPPDTIAAAGPSHVVEMVNTELAIYTKAGEKVDQQDLSDFFKSVRTGNALSDPVVVYDEQAGRFLVGVLDLSISFFGTVNGDAFLYAVSDSSDPTQDTTGDGKAFTEMHSINMTENVAAGTVFADYPRIGWNADGYFVTFNMFTTGFFNYYDHVSVISIDKAAATDRNNATATFTHTNVPGGITHATLAPATMHGTTASLPGSPQPMYFVEEKLNANGEPTGDALRVVKATNLFSGSPTFLFTADAGIGVAAYQQPPAATQPGSTSKPISTNDSRVLNAEWRNNRLVAVQTVGVNSDSQAHARWYEFSTSGTPTLTQQGTIGLGSGSNSYFPSIAINPSGDLGMTFIQSSSAEFMSMYVTGQAAGAASGTMQTPVRVKQGQAVYNATFDPSQALRAGDYSGITVDPGDGSFWAANEYAKTVNPLESRANWGTWLTNFTLTPPAPTHDVAVTTVSASPNPVTQGNTVTVLVTVANQGTFSETFSVSVTESPGGATLGTQIVTLAAGQTTTLTFTWATSASTATGSHTFTATAGIVTDETDTADNTGTTTVTVNAPVSGSANDVYVWDMAWAVSQKGNWITVSVTLKVKRDSDGDGVAEASDVAAGGVTTTLVLEHYVPSLGVIITTTFSNVKTNGNGQATFNLKTQYGGDFHAQVSMFKTGWNWNMGLDQNNPSCYQGAPGGSEVPCSGFFPSMEPARLITATHTATGEVPPMLTNGDGPTLPAVAFQSDSPLFEVEEFVPIGSLKPRGKVR